MSARLAVVVSRSTRCNRFNRLPRISPPPGIEVNFDRGKLSMWLFAVHGGGEKVHVTRDVRKCGEITCRIGAERRKRGKSASSSPGTAGDVFSCA